MIRDGRFIREIGKNLYAWAFAHTVRIDKDDNIWATDKGSDMIIKFNPQGRVMMVFGRKSEASDAEAKPHERNPKQPLPHEDGRFRQPTDVTWGPDGTIYISDGYVNSRVAKISKNGDWIKSWGQRGKGRASSTLVHSIAADAKGNIYVADRDNRRIQVFDGDGNFQREIKIDVPFDQNAKPAIGNKPDLTQLPADRRHASRPARPGRCASRRRRTRCCTARIPIPGRIYKLSLDGKVLGVLGESGKQLEAVRLDSRDGMPVGKHAVRRRDPELAGAEADPASGEDEGGQQAMIGNETGRWLLVAAAWFGAAPAAAQSAAEPFAGKNVTLIIGFGPGGGYDLWGRTVARHIGKHLPGNPTVVPQNMPGAGSYVAASHIYGAAPKDGTVFAIIARDAALGPLSNAPGARFDATKMSWLGSPTREHNACIANATAKVKTANELRNQELILGDTGPGTGTRSYPKVLNDLLGYKFKLVSGFRSSADVFLAMERGEVDGICESLDSIKQRKPDWIPNKTVNVLLQAGASRRPSSRACRTCSTLARNDEESRTLEYLYAGQDIGRPFVAPPDLPPERLKMLRDAFDATMKDPEFVAEVKRNKFDLEPEDGEHLAALIDKIYATPKAIIERVSNLIK